MVLMSSANGRSSIIDKKWGGWSTYEAASIMLHAASGLNKLHQEGIIHGALEPKRILVSRGPLLHVMIADGGVTQPITKADDVYALAKIVLEAVLKVKTKQTNPDVPLDTAAMGAKNQDTARAIRDSITGYNSTAQDVTANREP
ncbi:hypothetical protein B0T26DRAFT_873610 [Lasiosphaeria miniovina]|uniref:Protein kinase domain-containing protein n=1 Tax=Lasiosphaeria miniovina TaxID=1954250 RepID=A0AA40DS24_9PEZI|nr:uncharacterized protein B0T26DRAFT_873610 [Lasiosphaeria miniovina]KAK0713450.1 hypothetical protein B0T26DRAFT_873610 [Lasiosphaeria miniovina]